MRIVAIAYAFFLLVVYSKGNAGNKRDGFCQGHWETLQSMDQHPYHIKAGRTPKQANNSALGYLPWDQPWFWEACPTQTTLHSCHFHSNKTHADLLERRIWITSDPLCMEFSPYEFLEQLRDRRLIMIGDSLLTQLWQVLICALHGSAENRLYVSWAKMWRCNEVTCPNDEAKFSNCHGGIVRFPTANVTIINKKMYKYSKEYFFGALRRMKVTPRDILLVNYGLHYNDESEYSRTIESFYQDIQQDPEVSKFNIAFFETSPQHYPAKNGYFAQGEQNGNQCRPLAAAPKTSDPDISDPYLLAPEDWRNKIIHRIFSPALSPSVPSPGFTIRILPLAHGLYSQYDAHVAIEPYPSPPWLDCTHWCFPSGALRYYMLHLHNGVRRIIGRGLSNQHYQHGVSQRGDDKHHTRVGKSFPSASNDISLMQGLGYADGTLVKGSGRSIYLIKGQKRCEFGNFAAFQKLGLDLKKVIKLPDDELDEIPVGSTLY